MCRYQRGTSSERSVSRGNPVTGPGTNKLQTTTHDKRRTLIILENFYTPSQSFLDVCHWCRDPSAVVITENVLHDPRFTIISTTSGPVSQH